MALVGTKAFNIRLKKWYNMQNEQENKKETEILEIDNFNWIVPQCCVEGWASCPHVLKKPKKVKKNVGL